MPGHGGTGRGAAAVRLGFLGCGRIALHHADAFQHLGATVVAGSARAPDSPRWTAFRDKTGAAYRPTAEIIEARDIDALVVCLPPEETAHVLPTVLASPKAALIEKPIRPAGLPSKDHKLVGFNRRYYAGVGRLRSRLTSGGLVAAHATFPGDIHASTIHGLDLLFHLLGPLSWKYARRNGAAETRDGVPVTIAMNRNDPVNAGIRVLFDDDASWHLSPFETLSVYRGFDVTGATIRRYTPKLIDRVNEQAVFKPGFVEQAKAFLSGTYGPGARPSESVALMEFVDEVS